ncbi:uncharacterized protein LOC116306195 [Actinia tenebrosa]|uniref:Uncharacterized protein LOC116306195 n=1 Tax=Actinia tenebrosa TaxID=6105 RepID=A0A6P8J1X7_ACTTE|nr:uncharacterized protein LOC116306195 [Actinia tenebrosa]
MSGPRLKAGGSRSQKPSWFQDVKTGCEKQTDYFLRIRKLQKELINREQHNLVNAMERLKQLQYPRRKPFVRNFEGPPVSSKCFPTRPLRNTRRDPKHLLNQRSEFEELKPLKGKVLLPKKTRVDDEANVEPFTLDEIKRIYSMLPIMNDKQIARIIHDVRTTFPDEPFTYLLQPHLPSIPNVPRKANRRLDNRLKLLTLTESSCSIGSSNSIPHIHPTSSHHKRTDVAPKDAEKQKQRKSERKKGKKSILAFDVDPNDSSVFSNCLSSSDKDILNEDPSPLPPPNSRPTSCLKNMDAERDVTKEKLENETSETLNDLNEKLTESVVENTVQLSASNQLDEEMQEEKQNLPKSNPGENHDSKEILDEEKKEDEQLQPEAQPEALNAVESLENLPENASVIYTEPVVKITKKEPAMLEN